MEEIWKDIKGYEGHYQASNLGRIKSIKFNKEKILKHQIHKNEYVRVELTINNTRKKIMVHRLVAHVFLGLDIESDLVVNHKNHIRSDNKIDNLEIVNNRENQSYLKINTTSKYVGVCFVKKIEKWQTYITINKKIIHLGIYDNEIEAHQAYLDALVKYNIENKYSERKKQIIIKK